MACATLGAREITFVHNHWLFIGNVFAHLVASMSGIASFVFATIEHVRKKPIESRAFFTIGVLCLVIAFDQAWQDEHNNIKVLIGEKAALWQERDFWKSQSYEKDASLRTRDSLLLKNGTALVDTQDSLAKLSNKILDINKPQAQKFTVRRIDHQSDIFIKWKHHMQLVVMTNLPVDGRYIVVCEKPIGDMEARIMEGGPTFPNSVQMVQPNEWIVRIPSPQITLTNPMLITIGYNQDSIGVCQTGTN